MLVSESNTEIFFSDTEPSDDFVVMRKTNQTNGFRKRDSIAHYRHSVHPMMAEPRI